MNALLQAVLDLAIAGILLLLLHSIVLRPLRYLHRILPGSADQENSIASSPRQQQ